MLEVYGLDVFCGRGHLQTRENKGNQRKPRGAKWNQRKPRGAKGNQSKTKGDQGEPRENEVKLR
nr:MAG: hypothetical protein [Bacteriophage sp.]